MHPMQSSWQRQVAESESMWEEAVWAGKMAAHLVEGAVWGGMAGLVQGEDMVARMAVVGEMAAHLVERTAGEWMGQLAEGEEMVKRMAVVRMGRGVVKSTGVNLAVLEARKATLLSQQSWRRLKHMCGQGYGSRESEH